MCFPPPQGRSRVEQLGPRQAEEQDGRIVDDVREPVEEVEQRRLGPVDVFDHEDERRALVRQRLDENAHGLGRLVRGDLRFLEADETGEQLGCFLVGAEQLCDSCGAAIARRLLDDLPEREEGDALAVGEAPPDEHCCVRFDAPEQLPG